MINYVKRKNLNIEKYNNCIEKAIQSRIYAFSWYLDCVADNWDVLVLDDYKAVMPIPWKRKYGIKYVTQPFFCQQLGVFSLDEVSAIIQQDFIKKIPKTFLKVSLQLNSYSFFDALFIKRKNYILPLNDSFDTLFKSFNKGRKHAVKVGEKQQLIIKDVTIEALIKIKQDFYTSKLSNEHVIKLIALSKITNNKDKCFCKGVFDENNFLGGALFLKTNKRIIYLFSAFNTQGKSKQASSFLIASIVKEYENSNLVFDFEGSNIPSIGYFFKSFGAKISYYYLLETHSFSMFRKIFMNK